MHPSVADAETSPLDFGSPEFLADPYPAYRRLRESDPVHRSPWGDWYLTRFEDVAALMSDRRFCGGSPAGANPLIRAEGGASAFGRMAGRWMVFMDPPEHTGLRGAVSRFFTRERMEALRAEIVAMVEALLAGPREAGTMELVGELAYPLPVLVVASLLGMPAADHLRFRAAFGQLTRAVDIGDTGDEGERATEELLGYFRELAAEKRQRPGADLISHLVALEDGGEGLPEDHLLPTCVFLLWAGHETTKNLIGNAVLTLLRHPEQMQALRCAPETIPRAIEEVLRFESPVQKICRWTAEEVSIGGRTIPGEQFVVGLIGAAHRDPERYAAPERFDMARDVGGHLAFGRGAHHCLGSHLARIEAEIALEGLLRGTQELEPVDASAEWQEWTTFRGLKRLTVSLTA